MEKKNIRELLIKAQEGILPAGEADAVDFWLHHLNEDGPSGLTDEDLLQARKQMWVKITKASEP
ncbi:hypothetical protein [Mucilaginibacter pedocola]|uniref:Uncharacterized protein n=1 Tax=Mucilaginibacter pedocola TaxID=1792845 RepID=A0A1S9PG05_9SPHI|nr:hypothetical protein [Mucilaginibacter pedocola]OOQ59827.1 hypothetical protein BC343_06690 [Mucilaginibacter pedocola]